MEILEGASNMGLATALSKKEMKIIIKLANIGKRSVFYDLGSGSGDFVRYVVKNTKAKKVVGIEVYLRRFSGAVREAKVN